MNGNENKCCDVGHAANIVSYSWSHVVDSLSLSFLRVVYFMERPSLVTIAKNQDKWNLEPDIYVSITKYNVFQAFQKSIVNLKGKKAFCTIDSVEDTVY